VQVTEWSREPLYLSLLLLGSLTVAGLLHSFRDIPFATAFGAAYVVLAIFVVPSNVRNYGLAASVRRLVGSLALLGFLAGSWVLWRAMSG